MSSEAGRSSDLQASSSSDSPKCTSPGDTNPNSPGCPSVDNSGGTNPGCPGADSSGCDSNPQYGWNFSEDLRDDGSDSSIVANFSDDDLGNSMTGASGEGFFPGKNTTCNGTDGVPSSCLSKYCESDYETSSLIHATGNGDETMLRSLLEGGADVNARNKYGDTAILCASFQRQLKCLYWLLQSGADVNIQNSEGYTPLMNATGNGDLECLTMLTNSGADVNLVNIDGDSALTITARESHFECVYV